MTPFKIGWLVALFLAIGTVVEYVLATQASGNLVLPMLAINLPEAALIVWYFMHVSRVWRKEVH